MGRSRVIASAGDPRATSPWRRLASCGRRALSLPVVIAVAGARLSACGGSGSGSAVTAAAPSGSLAAAGAVRQAAPGRHPDARRHDHLRAAERPDAELHLPDRPVGEREHDQLPVAADHVPAALQQLRLRRLPGDQLRAQPGEQARVQRRRQDGHDPAQAGLQVERRQAGRRPGPAVRHRADQGRGRRERRQLGLVHAGLLPPEPGQHQRDRARTRS